MSSVLLRRIAALPGAAILGDAVAENNGISQSQRQLGASIRYKDTWP
jgi:hypothetical protein